jgi:hypothetical protein
MVGSGTAGDNPGYVRVGAEWSRWPHCRLRTGCGTGPQCWVVREAVAGRGKEEGGVWLCIKKRRWSRP